jgi:ubiquitin-protein ligase E3 A
MNYKGIQVMKVLVIFQHQSSILEIVHNNLTEEQKKDLLVFATASSRATIGGLAEIEFKISKDPESFHLPTSHTCQKTLVLTDDSDKESLKRKLLYAIENDGFWIK